MFLTLYDNKIIQSYYYIYNLRLHFKTIFGHSHSNNLLSPLQNPKSLLDDNIDIHIPQIIQLFCYLQQVYSIPLVFKIVSNIQKQNSQTQSYSKARISEIISVRQDSKAIPKYIIIKSRVVNRALYTYKNVYERIVGSNSSKYILKYLTLIVSLSQLFSNQDIYENIYSIDSTDISVEYIELRIQLDIRVQLVVCFLLYKLRIEVYKPGQKLVDRS